MIVKHNFTPQGPGGLPTVTDFGDSPVLATRWWSR